MFRGEPGSQEETLRSGGDPERVLELGVALSEVHREGWSRRCLPSILLA